MRLARKTRGDFYFPSPAMTPNYHLSVLPWYRQALHRVPNLILLKTVGITIFMTVFFTAYIHLLKNPNHAVTVMPLTAVDQWVGFNAMALPFYLSLWIYTSLPPALIVRRPDLERYGWSIGAVCVAGLLFFYFYPTVVPPAAVDWSAYPAFGFLKKIDTAGNACPSLHVASAVFSGLWLHRQLREMRAGAGVLAVNAAWCIGILYSTLATKQHVSLDLLAGLLLGVVGAWLSLRWVKPMAELAAGSQAQGAA